MIPRFRRTGCHSMRRPDNWRLKFIRVTDDYSATESCKIPAKYFLYLSIIETNGENV
jgi:hypothetical protein